MNENNPIASAHHNNDFREGLAELVQEEGRAILLLVLNSIGSSPGRQGFKMMVGERGTITGSIGGGMMEQKMVELAKSLFDKTQRFPFVKHQIHRKNVPNHQSGMICSGEQTIAFYLISSLDKIPQSQKIEFTPNGIFVNNETINSRYCYTYRNDLSWRLIEDFSFKERIFIVGGGHVGLALSQTMHQLGFQITVLDDREGLNTMEQNSWASETKIVDYTRLNEEIPNGENVYIVIMSFGYRTDKIITSQLIGKNVKYIGLMGSEEKLKQLFEEFVNEGFKQDQLNQIHAPIGLPISSKTPAEIAISIAAEIIKIKNA